MKRLCAIFTMLCIICTSGFGIISVSALSVEPHSNSVVLYADSGITPFASGDISDASYSVTSSKYSADITLRRICNGSVYMELQKANGSGWDKKDSTSWTFTSKLSTNNSKSFTIKESGTYRVYVSVTIDGVTSTDTSPNFYF